MEEEDENNLSYSAQHIAELLRCSICLDRFRTPKLLPCQHTFCQSPCLEQLVDRFNQIKCPECRVSHRVPYAGVSSLPTNRTILNFLDLPTMARQTPQTANQPPPQNEGRGQANSPANQNQRQPQNEARPQGAPQENETARSGCSACGRQLTLSRCAHCDNIVCDTCKRSHMDQMRLDINRLVSQLRRGTPAFSDAVSIIENKSEQLHQRAEAGKAEITETIERYISELRNRQRLLHSEVQMWLLGEIRSLRMLQENVEVELASTASFCDSTESVLSRPNYTIPDDDLVDLKRQCVEHMEIIRTYEDGQGVRLPRERRVEVAFEGNRFSQAISNFGELTVTEREDNGSASYSNPNSDPPSLNSRTSSSRESSPAGPQVVSMGGIRDVSPGVPSRAAGAGRAQPSLDTALVAIGSSSRVSPQRGERSAGLMAGGGASQSTEPGATPRVTPRERLAGLLGGVEPAVNPSPRPQRRERVAGLFGAGGPPAPESGSSSAESTPRTRRRNQSWELPVDFSYPPRGDVRAGNGGRRTLQERRRHNLSDSRLLNNIGAMNARASQESRNQSNIRRNRSGNQVSTSQNSSAQQEPVASTSTADTDRPPVVRSRTFTREEFQAIREEDSVSRASTADPINRPREPIREPIRFNIDFNGDSSENDEISYQIGTVDGGESTRVNVSRNNYQDKGRAIIRFGNRGSNESEFVWPRGVAVSRSDQIYVADSSNHRVQVFDNIGAFVKCFGSYGQLEGEFDCLAGITMNHMGDLLITDRYNHRVQVFDANGSFMLEFGEEGNGDGQMCYPWGIACDSMGFIYVCDKENHRIQVFQSNGVFARKFGRLGRGNGQFENPHYLAISPDNKIYVSDSSNHRIQVFSMYGDYIFQFGTVGTMQGQMKYPKGIAIDEQGFVVVADSGNNRIQVFRGDGRFYCMFGSYGSDNGQFKGLEGLAILANGNVAVSDRENHRIQIF